MPPCILWVQPSLKLHISGFPFLPLWRVQPQPISRRAHSPNTWVLPVNAGSLVNGKWYMADRLRTKSFSLTHTHTHTTPLPSAPTPSRISWVHSNLWQWAERRIHFVPPRIQMAHNITQIKRQEDLSLWCVFFLWERRPNTSPWLTLMSPLWR